MVVRVNRSLGAERLPQKLVGAVGDHFVGVHVGLGTGSRLPDDQRKMLIEKTFMQLAGCSLDRICQRLVPRAKAAGGACRGGVVEAESANRADREMLSADAKNVQRTLGLCAPIPIGRDFDGAENVVLDAEL